MITDYKFDLTDIVRSISDFFYLIADYISTFVELIFGNSLSDIIDGSLDGTWVFDFLMDMILSVAENIPLVGDLLEMPLGVSIFGISFLVFTVIHVYKFLKNIF